MSDRHPSGRMVEQVQRFVGRGGAATNPSEWSAAKQIAIDALRSVQDESLSNRQWVLEAVRHIRRSVFRISYQDDAHRVRLAREVILPLCRDLARMR